MSSAAKKIIEEFLALPEDEREHVLLKLQSMMRTEGSSEESAEAAWIEEAFARLDRLRTGEASSGDAEQAEREILRELGYE
jgi:hypothetical protein